jgi:hypothetical protein
MNQSGYRSSADTPFPPSYREKDQKSRTCLCGMLLARYHRHLHCHQTYHHQVPPGSEMCLVGSPSVP